MHRARLVAGSQQCKSVRQIGLAHCLLGQSASPTSPSTENPIGTANPVLLDASNSYGDEDHTSAVSGSKFSVSYLRE
jgi:hypothetical protein